MIKEYAVYRGDKFVDMGALEYVAALVGMKKESVEWWATPSGLKRSCAAKCYNKALFIIRVEIEGE